MLSEQGSQAWIQPQPPLSHKSLAHLLDLTAFGRPAPDLGRTTTAWEEGSHLPPSSRGDRAAVPSAHHNKLPSQQEPSQKAEPAAQRPLPRPPSMNSLAGSRSAGAGGRPRKESGGRGTRLPGRAARRTSSQALSSQPLMGLGAVRPLSQGAPDTAGQGFKGTGVGSANTLGCCGASSPSSLAPRAWAGARWRPPCQAWQTTAKVTRQPGLWLRPARSPHSPALTMASTSSLVISPRNREIFSLRCLSFLYLGSSTFTVDPGTSGY